MTALVPSQRYNEGRGHQHRTLTDWARQMLRVVQQWCPGRQLIVVDNAYSVVRWLSDLQQGHQITVITRLRLDAPLYELAPERQAGQKGRTRHRLPNLASLVNDSETRWVSMRVHRWYRETDWEVEIVSQTAVWYNAGLPPLPIHWVLVRDPKGKFATQALLCTDLLLSPAQILDHFVQRWQLEVTFKKVQAQVGIESQRQWTDLAIARTAPATLGLFSLVTLLAYERCQGHELWVRLAAWHDKTLPTFVDALAQPRRALRKVPTFQRSAPGREMFQVPLDFIERLADALCYAA
ncbi:transposase (plasmid) [Deinococcus radiomollis]|uniref:transposase n=1 Tax=Deinococcus radiomollis TaxID=468916 RepID=UPI0038926DDD